MPIFNVRALIDDLQVDVRHTLDRLEKIKMLSDDILLEQPVQGKWSMAQVLEHLNAYNRFYLTEFERTLKDRTVEHKGVYKSGFFGNYFTNLMQPKADGTVSKKMKAPADYNFNPDLDVPKVLQEFEDGQKKLLGLLDKARTSDLGGLKLPISISKLIKLKMGDTFRFLIAHQLRHFAQIGRIEEQLMKKHAA